MFKRGDYIYYFNKYGEHVPGKVLGVKKRVKCEIDDPDIEGSRIVWLSPSKLERQEP